MAAVTKRLNDPLSSKAPQPGGIRSVYDAAASTQAQDYDNIMQGYDSVLSNAQGKRNNTPLNYVPINPVFNQYTQGPDYKRSGDLNTAITGLSDYSKTGGYSDADIGNIRERSISPIRSIYSSAQEGLKRQKALQGGYSPNYGAVSAKMARDASSRIGDVTTKVNADIAQMIASGKLAGLSGLSSAAGRENEQINATNTRNADLANKTNESNVNEQRRVDELNRQLQMQQNEINTRDTNQNTDTEMNTLRGKQSLYGTTPALTQTFGNQVLQNNQQNMQAVQTANMIKNQRANIGLNMVNNQLGKNTVRG